MQLKPAVGLINLVLVHNLEGFLFHFVYKPVPKSLFCKASFILFARLSTFVFFPDIFLHWKDLVLHACGLLQLIITFMLLL